MTLHEGGAPEAARTTSPLRLRPARPDDATALGAVEHRCWTETYTDLLPPASWEAAEPEAGAAWWHRRLTRPPRGGSIVVAEAHGAVVGFAMSGRPHVGAHVAHPPVRDLELYSLYVLAAWHGTGAGAALLEAAVPPGTSAELWVAERNARAVAFYHRHGFAADGTREASDPRFGGLAEIRMVR
ncbi:GNAT family N-acetyltransferase [Cellulosimicrobium sp. NPDC057127]|uniref:GNAT family N-acetyltransferase n=1 Tax=Cellulosimicrobium sp. NPDC057127 TaxID=3346026 RepID=UPI00363F7190